jgi:hypothetical protein
MKYGKVIAALIACYFCAHATTTIYKYRLYCITEAANVYTWAETAPTQCPNNTAHIINPNSLSIIDQVATNEITIQQESTPTGGNFKAETFKITSNAQGETDAQLSWPFNISLLQLSFMTTTDNEGDLLTIEIPSNVVVGTITQNVTAGDTVINVSASVTSIVAIGYYITISDGTNTDALGRVLAISTADSTITMETGSTNAYQSSSPTYVYMTVSPLNNFEFGPSQQYTLGQSSLRTSSIPASTSIVIRYFNNSSTAKSLVFNYEYLY